MNASASVEMSGLQKPEIVSVEVAQWTSVLCVLSFFKVELFELCALDSSLFSCLGLVQSAKAHLRVDDRPSLLLLVV